MNKKILIVQIENFHTEVIIPQLEILENKYIIDLFIPENLEGKESLELYKIRKIYSIRNTKNTKLINILKYMLAIIKIKSINKKNKYDIIIYNSLPDNLIKIIFISLMKNKTKNIGIVHNVKNNLKKYYNAFDYILVLSYEVYKNNENIKNIWYFCPCIFKKIKIDENIINVNSKKINIGIIGKTDNTKRNYRELIKIIKKYLEDNSEITFYIIGEVYKEFVEMINVNQINKSIIFRKGYISFNEMISISYKMDAIALLLDPGTPHFNEYNKTKITGSMNIIKYLNKPFISNKRINFMDEYNKNKIEYDETIEEIIEKIIVKRLKKEDLIKHTLDFNQYIHYLEKQKQNYLRVIEQN